jgi:hypothetical protein
VTFISPKPVSFSRKVAVSAFIGVVMEKLEGQEFPATALS